MITGMTKYFMFHIFWISILRFLYFNFFLASFCITFLSDGIATSMNKQVLSFLFLTIIIIIVVVITVYTFIDFFCSLYFILILSLSPVVVLAG
jgi:hypothetical protein